MGIEHQKSAFISDYQRPLPLTIYDLLLTIVLCPLCQNKERYLM